MKNDSIHTGMYKIGFTYGVIYNSSILHILSDSYLNGYYMQLATVHSKYGIIHIAYRSNKRYLHYIKILLPLG